MFTKVSISTANVPGLTTAAAKTGMTYSGVLAFSLLASYQAWASMVDPVSSNLPRAGGPALPLDAWYKLG
ncbi:hypothetical protein NCS55_01468500 [Fusarium keratoplasticum]|nr:hypothetical protein NCS55_01468500 [Fusarium keratoplasticum]